MTEWLRIVPEVLLCIGLIAFCGILLIFEVEAVLTNADDD